MAFTFEPLEIPDVVLIRPEVFSDERGFLQVHYRSSDFHNAGIMMPFVQDSRTVSHRGVLRGLHYQKHPASQGKLVRVVRGEIFDVALDVRKGSPTYGKWVSSLLNGRNGHLIWIPPGFAHGFVALADGTEVEYKATSEYAPRHQAGVRWDDPDLAIRWPVKKPLLSQKDRELPALSEVDTSCEQGG
ncbi:MAG: dTDP-4-dehydrorhamnose 3,5-epimerase [Candidatus Eremiobacteraeota bacterium]|nr:dTDP-4-dehydrorhamnose 3,5-epimerase [Candidatus Eremiobacteraeota bacterium]